MLWRMPADTHEQRIGIMLISGDDSPRLRLLANAGCPIAASSVSASNVLPAPAERLYRRNPALHATRHGPDEPGPCLCYETVTNQKGLCARPRENAVGLFLFFC